MFLHWKSFQEISAKILYITVLCTKIITIRRKAARFSLLAELDVEDRMDSLLLSCLILWITGYSKGFIYDTPTYPLDLRGLVIEANGTCSMGEICRFASQLECEECTVDKFIPEFAIDGDSSTTWSSFPVSQLPEGDSPSLTLYLGRVSRCFICQFCFHFVLVISH